MKIDTVITKGLQILSIKSKQGQM